MLRIFSLIISLVLLGCDAVTINNPLNTPTYLDCRSKTSSYTWRWIILDHANDLWIQYWYEREDYEKFGQPLFLKRNIDQTQIRAYDLNSDEYRYWSTDNKRDNTFMGVDRETLIYGEEFDSFRQLQCEVVEEKFVPSAIKGFVKDFGIESKTKKI